MLYYRVKPKCDQMPRIKYSRYIAKQVPDGIFVANELYTTGELNKFYIPHERFFDIFDAVEIPKNKVYWSFGCRFEMKEVAQ